MWGIRRRGREGFVRAIAVGDCSRLLEDDVTIAGCRGRKLIVLVHDEGLAGRCCGCEILMRSGRDGRVRIRLGLPAGAG